jgi:putative intracellular protease/amidase
MALNEDYRSDASELTEPEDAADQQAFQHEQYYYVMGEKERNEITARAEKDRLNSEREMQAEQRRYARRREEEERLVALGKRNILMLVWDGFDDMFTVTTVDMLRSADVNVVVANVTGCVRRRKPTLLARGANGVTVLADINFETTGNHNFHLFNGIVLAGGRGVQDLCSHRKLISLIKTMSYKEKFVCGACEAVSSLFVAARVVIGRCVAGSGAITEQLMAGGAKEVITGDPVVVDYNLVTARFRADVFEFALMVTKCIFGDITEAKSVAERYQYSSSMLERRGGAPEGGPDEAPREDGEGPEDEGNRDREEGGAPEEGANGDDEGYDAGRDDHPREDGEPADGEEEES